MFFSFARHSSYSADLVLKVKPYIFFLHINGCNFMNNGECFFMFQYCMCKVLLIVKGLTVCSLDLFWRENFEEIFHAKISHLSNKNLVYTKLHDLNGLLIKFLSFYGMTVAVLKSSRYRPRFSCYRNRSLICI